jgi:hypothetical protein
MTTSLAQTDYLTTLSSGDTITFTDNSYASNTIDLSTITLSTSGLAYYTNPCIPCYPNTISTGSVCFTNGSTINTISGIDMSSIWSGGDEWINKFPDWSRVEEMCKQYPGLAIAFEKFKTVYKLVKDDYDTPKDQRAKP